MLEGILKAHVESTEWMGSFESEESKEEVLSSDSNNTVIKAQLRQCLSYTYYTKMKVLLDALLKLAEYDRLMTENSALSELNLL